MKRAGSPVSDDDASASKKVTLKPRCQFGENCYRKNPDHIKDYDHSPLPPPAAVMAADSNASSSSTAAVADGPSSVPAAAAATSASASSIPAADPNIADISKPHCKFGKKCYRKNPQHRRDEYHPPIPPPFDPKMFFAGVANAEQKEAWEQVGKKQTSSAMKNALGGVVIPDLQKMIVDKLQPSTDSFRCTYLWRLKELDECTPHDWNKDKSKAVSNRVHENGIDDDGEDDVADDDDEEDGDARNEDVDDDEEDEDYDDDDGKKKKKAKPKKKSARGSAVATPPAYVSKVGGMPFLSKGEDWPVCGQCEDDGKKGLPFFFQLLLSDLPDNLGFVYGLKKADGSLKAPVDQQLLQFFCCQNGECETFETFSPSHFIRIVDLSAVEPEPAQLKKPAKTLVFAEKLLVGWFKKRDYVQFQDYQKYGLPDLDDIYGDEQDDIHEKYNAIQSDKLSGFPNWVQSAEYPTCPQCLASDGDAAKDQMRFVFQVAGETWCDDRTEVMWGDAGIGHITQCAKHQNVLAFGWACS